MADNIDLAKVKRNVAKMVSMNAPEEDIDAYISSEGTSVDAIRRFKDTAVNKRSTPSITGLPQDITDNPNIQPQNILGQVFNVPSAAIRSAIQGTGYMKGALQPDSIPKFGDMQAQQSQGKQLLQNLLTGGVPSGMALDMITNPAEVLSMAPMAKGVQALAKIVKPVMKWESSLQQAQKAKTSLDTLRTTLGKAKEIALSNTGDIPAEVDFSGNMSQKVINAIKNPVYQVEFTPEGGVVGNIRNLDKIKTALNDIVTTKDFVEAGNMEKRQIMQFAGKVRNNMVSAANKAGKPELGQSLKDYHDFMGNYNKINDHLVDKYGDAMANKMKAMFKPEAEQAVKESWKELSKTSPEIKGIMDSMNKRELMRGLLKKAGYAGAAATAYEGAKKAITGKF